MISLGFFINCLQTSVYTLRCRFPSISPGKKRDVDLTFDVRAVENNPSLVEDMHITMRLESHCSRMTQDSNANMGSTTSVR